MRASVMCFGTAKVNKALYKCRPDQRTVNATFGPKCHTSIWPFLVQIPSMPKLNPNVSAILCYLNTVTTELISIHVWFVHF